MCGKSPLFAHEATPPSRVGPRPRSGAEWASRSARGVAVSNFVWKHPKSPSNRRRRSSIGLLAVAVVARQFAVLELVQERDAGRRLRRYLFVVSRSELKASP